jgi:hypothetical protein
MRIAPPSWTIALLAACLLAPSAAADEINEPARTEMVARLLRRGISLEKGSDGVTAQIIVGNKPEHCLDARVYDDLRSIRNLAVLDFSQSALGPETLSHVHTLPSVDTLNMEKCQNVDQATAELRPNDALTAVIVGKSDLTDKGLANIVKNCRRLAYLDLSYNDISGGGLRVLEKHESLLHLNLSHTRRVMPDGASVISSIAGLQVVDLSFTFTHDDALAQLSNLSEVRKFMLVRTPVGDDGCKHLAKMVSLEELDVTITSVGSPGLKSLTPLLKLRKLNADPGDGQAVDTLVELHRAIPRLDLSRLALLSLPPQRPRFNRDAAGKIVSVEVPARADIQAFGEICDAGLLPDIEELSILSPSFDDDDCELLSQLRSVRILKLPKATITERGAALLRQLPSLREVVLNRECDNDAVRGALAGSIIEITIVEIPATSTRRGPTRANERP